MKTILQEVFVYTLSLYLTSLFLTGIQVSGGFQTYLLGGILLALGFTVVKPILSTISLPFNFLTLGLFSFIISAFIVFFITKLLPGIHITSFQAPNLSTLGIQLKNVKISGILSYVVISATIYCIAKIVKWVFD